MIKILSPSASLLKEAGNHLHGSDHSEVAEWLLSVAAYLDTREIAMQANPRDQSKSARIIIGREGE